MKGFRYTGVYNVHQLVRVQGCTLSMSARFQTPARVCWARPVCSSRFLAWTAARKPVLDRKRCHIRTEVPTEF